MAKKDVCEPCVKILRKICSNTGDVRLCRLAVMYEDGRDVEVLKELKKNYNNEWFMRELKKAKDELVKSGELKKEHLASVEREWAK